VSGRYVDDEAAEISAPASFELGRDYFDVPVHGQGGLRVKLPKATLDERAKELSQYHPIFSWT
jgi:hypothetical protein